MKIACIGNYPPRECGIATFTRDFIESITESPSRREEPGNEIFVIAMNNQGREYPYPEPVVKTIAQNQPQEYLQAVKYINLLKPDVCFLQHEFGIYGGNSGVFILPLIHRLKVPLIPIFHTILKNPSYNEQNIIREIGKHSEKIIVMNSLAIEILHSVYGIPAEKVAVIPHGVPAFDFSDKLFHKKRFNLEKRKVLMTFGLLSRNKGLETVIKALPRVVEKHPDLLYIIVGKTHPSVQRTSGEEYRNYLKLLIRQFALTKNVYFDDRFVETEELLSYLTATDIYVTPYHNEAQITSGTLAYAVGAGTAVISTPYWHARELLADGRGMLFYFKDSRGLSEKLLELLNDPGKLKKMRNLAFEFGKQTSWPEIGKKIVTVCRDAAASYNVPEREEDFEIRPLLLPRFSLDHIQRITDSTGILQHAKFNIPNFRDGYCLDDNARALLMTAMAYQQFSEPETLILMSRYLSYIQYMQNSDGSFRNFLSYSREFLDETGSEDAFGRTIWALGYLVRISPSDSFYELGSDLFRRSLGKIGELTTLRGQANAIAGLSHWTKRFSGDERAEQLLRELAAKMVGRFREQADEQWQWFEPSLTYDNGLLPYALYCAYGLTGDDETREVAEKSLAFLDRQVYREDYISPIGSENWFHKDGPPSQFDQQPLNVMALILMYYQAYLTDGDKSYLHKMFNSYMWFMGENDLRVPLYDYETKGCNDGLKAFGVNRNQGAESSIAYLISYLTVMSCYPLSV